MTSSLPPPSSEHIHHDEPSTQDLRDHPSEQRSTLLHSDESPAPLRPSPSRRMRLVHNDDDVPVLVRHEQDNASRDRNALYGSSGDMMMLSSTSTLGMDDFVSQQSIDPRTVDGAANTTSTTTASNDATLTPMERRKQRMDRKAAQLSRPTGRLDNSCASSDEQQQRGSRHPVTITTSGGEILVHSDQNPSTELMDAVDAAGTDADELVGVNVTTIPRAMASSRPTTRNYLAFAEDSTLTASPHTSNYLSRDEANEGNVRPGAVFIPIRALGAPNRPRSTMQSTVSSSPSSHRRSSRFLSSGVLARLRNSHGIAATNDHRSTIIAESVDADTIVYASSVDVIHDEQHRSASIYYSYYAMGVLMIVLALILAVVLGTTLGTTGTGSSTSASERSRCTPVLDLLDIYDICYCYGNASLLSLTTNETQVYTIVSETLMANGLISHSTLDRDSCIPEHQAILGIANFKRLGLDINPHYLNVLLSSTTTTRHAMARNGLEFDNHTSLTTKAIMTDTIVEQFILRLLFLGIDKDKDDDHDHGNHDKYSNWRTSFVVCRWFGITCNTILGRVEIIRLHDVDYTGTLPWQVGFLPQLRILDLSDNPNLIGTIPTELGMASSLHTLDLTSCGLSGTLPSELSQMQVLDRLVLSNNSLHGTIPTEYGTLSRLRHFHVDTNHLTGRLPSEIGTMTHLERLLVHHNQLSKSIPTSLGTLLMVHQLQQVDLSDNWFSGTLPEAMFEYYAQDNGVTEGRNRSSSINNSSSSSGTPKVTSSSLLVLARTNLTGTIPESFCRQQQRQQYTNSTTTTAGGTIVLLVSCSLDQNNLQMAEQQNDDDDRGSTTTSTTLSLFLQRNCSCCSTNHLAQKS